MWLAGNGLGFPADDTVLRHTLEARDALRAAVGTPTARQAGRAPGSRHRPPPASTPSSRTDASA